MARAASVGIVTGDSRKMRLSLALIRAARNTRSETTVALRYRRRHSEQGAMRTLMYHDIAARPDQDEVGFPGSLARRYKLEPNVFEAHLDAVAAPGLRVGTLD